MLSLAASFIEFILPHQMAKIRPTIPAKARWIADPIAMQHFLHCVSCCMLACRLSTDTP